MTYATTTIVTLSLLFTSVNFASASDRYGCRCTGTYASPTGTYGLPYCTDGTCQPGGYSQNEVIRVSPRPWQPPGTGQSPWGLVDQPQYTRPAPPQVEFFDRPQRSPAQVQQAPVIPRGMEGVAQLAVSEQYAALRQRTCPVTNEPLGSMGQPIRVDVAGRSVFVCCAGCVNALKKNPAKYLTTSRHSSVSIVR